MYIGVALAAAGDYCFLTFWSSDPIVLLANYTVTIAILVAFAIMAYVYTTIVLMYIKAMKANADESENEAHVLSDNEMKLIYKSVAVCGAFSLSW